jgi:hypothetical protein
MLQSEEKSGPWRLGKFKLPYLGDVRLLKALKGALRF